MNKTLGAIAPNQNDIMGRRGGYSVKKKVHVAPGGGKMPLDRKKSKELATSYSSQARLTALQKTGSSRLARCFGQDLMRGEHVVGKRTTWVAGDRPIESLDETSRKNLAAGGQGQEQTGTSIFDPVLCEIAYRWFCPPKPAKILDPFAGGSVRGIVAAVLGHDYTGIELRPEQAAANEKQAADMGLSVRWVVGDSRNATTVAPGEYDFVFSCPPYYDLEVYSEDPNDLSTCGTYADFLAVYRAIIGQCVGMLRQDRFACFVVGDLRDERGFYRNFPADTIAAFQDAGAMLYNEAILVTAVGSLPIRCGRQFQTGRKLGKTHQNVLVFYKGDPKAIRTFGEVEAGEIAEGGDGLAQ